MFIQLFKYAKMHDFEIETPYASLKIVSSNTVSEGLSSDYNLFLIVVCVVWNII